MQPPTQVGVVQSCRLRISSWHRSHSCGEGVAQVGWVVSHPLSQTWSTSLTVIQHSMHMPLGSPPNSHHFVVRATHAAGTIAIPAPQQE